VTVTCAQTKDYSGEVDRVDRSRVGKITLCAFPLISVWYWISHAWKESRYRYGSISVKFNRVYTRL